MESIEFNPEKTKPTRTDEAPDRAGDPIYPEQLTEMLGEETKSATPEGLPKQDLAAMAYKLGMTPQELAGHEAKHREVTGKPEPTKPRTKEWEAPQKAPVETGWSREEVVGARKARRERITKPVTESEVQKMITELDERPRVREIYEAVVNNDLEALAKKSHEQLQELTKAYYGEASLAERILPWKKKAREQTIFDQETKLEQFQKFVNSLEVQGTEVTSDRGAETEASGAQNFVYGRLTSGENAVAADNLHAGTDQSYDNELLKRSAQLITNDFHHLARRTTPDKTIEAYTKNVFDYQTGQEILAVYLASIFESPDEAVHFLNDGYNKNDTTWNYRMRPEVGKFGTDHRTRGEEITRHMAKLWNLTGIYPPTNLEVRIDRDAAEELATPEAAVA